MKPRFTVRDLLWLAVVVALATALFISRRGLQREVQAAKNTATRLSSVFLPDGFTVYVYKIDSGVVYRVAYDRSGQGGVVSAYRLSDGQQLWESRLEGFGTVAHSAYDNRISISGVRADELVIEGHESAGSYVEELDARTGKLIDKRRSKNGFPKPEGYKLE